MPPLLPALTAATMGSAVEVPPSAAAVEPAPEFAVEPPVVFELPFALVPFGEDVAGAGCAPPLVPPVEEPPLGVPPVAVGIVSMYCCTPEVAGTFGGALAAAATPTTASAKTTTAAGRRRRVLKRMPSFTGRYCSNVSTANPVGGAEVVTLRPPTRSRQRPRLWPFPIVGGALLVVAYANGGYGLSTRSILAISLWWIVILGVGFGLVPRARPPRAALAVGVLLAAFTLWTLASTLWAPSPEQAFVEFDRNSLYLALYVVAMGTSGRRNLGWWAGGLRLGIVATAVVALASRLFPHLFAARGVASFLPNASTRLSFPVGYWNGLAILVALALPLSFAAAVAGTTPLKRAVAIVPVPVIAVVIFLASSRGGVVAAAAGTVVFLAASGRRWASLAVVGIGVFGSGLAVLALRTHPTLVNGPLGGHTAQSQGRVVALLIVCIALLTGALLVGAERLWGDRRAPSRRTGRMLVIAACVVVVLAAVAAHPIRRFDAFRQPPATGQVTSPNFATAHLLSGNGSGRWQFWSAAVHEWASAPLIGRGAGSYQFWWAQHASFTYFLKNAHSLYLEVLGELGAVGLLLFGCALGCGLVAGARGVRRAADEHREPLAALTAVLAAFLVCAGIDWIWQLTAVGAVGMVALALVAASDEHAEAAREAESGGRSRLAFGVVALVAAWAAICAQAIPWLTAAKISDSQAAVQHKDIGKALKDAQDARAIQPWAATPYLQLALVAEARGDLTAAHRWIHAATTRDTTDWAVWYIAARIEREARHPAAARAAYLKSESLNIRSPVFAGAGAAPGP